MSQTSDKRRALAAFVAERNREGRAGRRLKRILATAVILLLIALPALWAGGFFATPRVIADIRALVDDQVADYDRIARGEAPYAAAPDLDAIFARMRQVPDALRDQAGREIGRLWAAREKAELASFFALPPQARQVELDRRITAEQERRERSRAEWEKRQRDRTSASRVAPGAQRSAAGAPGGARVGEEARQARGKRRIDRTSPEERAWRDEYRRVLDARRAQLYPGSSGGRRGG